MNIPIKLTGVLTVKLAPTVCMCACIFSSRVVEYGIISPLRFTPIKLTGALKVKLAVALCVCVRAFFIVSEAQTNRCDMSDLEVEECVGV